MTKEELIKVSQHHFESVRTKNIEEILNSYAHTEDLTVFVEGPRWQTLGYSKVEKGWRDFNDSPISVEWCDWVEGLEAKVIGEMGFVGGIVEMRVNIKETIKTIRFRGTFVYQKESDGQFRVIHEHFSQPASDPYGIGDWLKT